ncbi:hypothetical protein L202_07201 [Cryptococcus amylolentus CBS 6039]|uniref:Chalcone isomerase domain-containing protein n=1 Tax=Cryptococcus amylolentus CBS 6039 TaxID=1295533 RepID=A0A1E3HBE5_9TREE|nr:hypothetical protein L202_07201 [Cryptococcus amylolentus CBS 6039]ODN73653.1 hypothetical protein L202_07201 [Cryptococcus amylolentus CBS 6039]
MASRISPMLSALRSSTTLARPFARRAAAPLVATAVGGGIVYLSVAALEPWKYQNPFLIHADSAAHPDFRVDPKSQLPFRVDPETSIEFPITLSTTTPTPALTLVGLGVRKVSFLRIKVYSAGFYVQEGATRCLHYIPGWSTFTAQHLLTPPTPSADPLLSPQLSGEALMANLLDQKVGCAVRIVPNRNTDFGHLRDAFVRSLNARQKAMHQEGALSEAEEERLTTSIQSFKAFFPSSVVPKGKSLVLLRPAEGGIVVEYEGSILGRLDDPWVGKQLMLTYFADNGVVSEKLKEDVAHGLEGFVQRNRPPPQ